MSNSSAPVPPRGGLSLYANLLDLYSSSNTTSAASISRAPVVFKQGSSDAAQADDASVKKQQINSAAALRFQPTKRPQLSNQKLKPKSGFPKPTAPIPGESTNISATAPNAPKLPIKTTLADWTGDDDDVNGFYGGEKRQRGGRKRRKKNREEHAVVQDWDDVYDPLRPNNYDEYRHSDERIREIREWKDRLYAHRLARKHSSDRDSDDESTGRPQMRNQFAPPSNYSFAPPPMESSPRDPALPRGLPDEKTGEDAYARRLRLSQAAQALPPPPPEDFDDLHTVPPWPPLPPPPAEPQPGVVISRAPVRYNLPAASVELPTSEAELEKALEEEMEDVEEEEASGEAPRSLRPGQKGFAERLMSKYGWTKGSGLGAGESGIINPLRVQVEKRRKKPDSEGGGFADPKGIGKIIGGKKKVPDSEAEGGKFGAMSEVVVLRGMVDGMDLDEEVGGSGDGGLMQEIGDECGEKYGRVERVYIDRNGASPVVFVKFTTRLSALRAVNALEGRIFNGNTISAMFYSTEKFEAGIYQ